MISKFIFKVNNGSESKTVLLFDDFNDKNHIFVKDDSIFQHINFKRVLCDIGTITGNRLCKEKMFHSMYFNQQQIEFSYIFL